MAATSLRKGAILSCSCSCSLERCTFSSAAAAGFQRGGVRRINNGRNEGGISSRSSSIQRQWCQYRPLRQGNCELPARASLCPGLRFCTLKPSGGAPELLLMLVRDGSPFEVRTFQQVARAQFFPEFHSKCRYQQWRPVNCRSSSISTSASNSTFSSASPDVIFPGNGRRSPGKGTVPRTRRVERQKNESSVHGEERIERFFATCSPGLEEIVAAELRAPAIGATRVEVGSAGVWFQGTKKTGVLANLWLRSATRVLLELASGTLASRRARSDPVYDFVRRAADWPRLLLVDEPGRKDDGGAGEKGPNIDDGGISARRKPARIWNFRTFSVSSRTWGCEGVSSSMFASVRAKDAICDAVKDECGGSRPDPPEDGGASADVPLFFSLYRDNAVLYRDMTGVSLHKRGYRDVMHRAGLNEAIAAAMLTVAGWNCWLLDFKFWNDNKASEPVEQTPSVLMDPMCGSGTLLIEAALIAVNSAPGLMRSRWPFETWHDFHPSLLKRCREDAIAAEVPWPKGLRLLGNDIHEGALSLCRRDAKAANVLHLLELSRTDCRDYNPPASPSLVVVNPPWGSRLENSSNEDDDRELLSTWRELGQFLKRHCSDADVYVLSGNSAVTHAMHMKADKKWSVSVGGIDCRIMHYHVLPPKNSIAADSLPKVARV